MKIIDTFIILGKHETELLYLKLLTESPCVDEWIIAENHYDYRGVYKGPQIESMLSESRFDPYRDRIKTFSIDKPFVEFKKGLSDQYDPIEFAESEWSLRDLPKPYIIDKYGDKDIVFVTDVDELVDFSDDYRKDKIYSELRFNTPVQFERLRYWWDFDNRNWWEANQRCRFIQTYPVHSLKRGAVLRDRNSVGKAVMIDDNPLAFEYCFCFSKEDCWYKLSTSLHTNWQRDEFEDSINCNYWTQRNGEKPNINNRYHWFETVNLHEKNSPKYVRDNLELLKTNLIPKNYRANRMKKYGSECLFDENRDINA